MNNKLDEVEISDLLTALSCMCRIIWDKADGQKETIFHRISRVSHIMKSIFNNKMDDILLRNASDIGKDPLELIEGYKQGKVPTNLVESMFVHIEVHEETHPDQAQVDFSSMEFKICNEKQKKALTAYISRLKQLQILIPLNEETYFIPHLIFTAENVCGSPNPIFRLHLQLVFEIQIYKKTFCMCSVQQVQACPT